MDGLINICEFLWFGAGIMIMIWLVKEVDSSYRHRKRKDDE